MAKYLGDGLISIKADIENAQNFLTELGLKKKAINKALLRAAGTGGRQAIRRNYKNVLHQRSGKLYKSITSYVYRNGTKVVFTNDADSGKPTSKDGRTARYGFMLASGYTVESKSKTKPMRFLAADGKWVTRWHFSVDKNGNGIDWVEAPVMRYAESFDLKERLDKAFQKQVDKWEKKHGGQTA